MTTDLTILIWIWSIALKPFLNLRIICHLEKLRIRNSCILKPSGCGLLYISFKFCMKDEQFFIRIFSLLSHFFFIAGSQKAFPLLRLETSLSGSPHLLVHFLSLLLHWHQYCHITCPLGSQNTFYSGPRSCFPSLTCSLHVTPPRNPSVSPRRLLFHLLPTSQSLCQLC